MYQRSILYGALAALGTFLWTMFEYVLGWHGAQAEIGRYTGFVAMVFPILAMVLAMRAARTAGVVGFGPGFAQGAAVAAAFAPLSAFGVWLYFTVINPGFVDPATGQGMSAGATAAMVLGMNAVIGLVLAAIVAALVRGKRRVVT